MEKPTTSTRTIKETKELLNYLRSDPTPLILEHTPTIPLVPRCGHCGSHENLLKCGSCRVMPYCSRQHQLEHRNAHKKSCTEAKKAQEDFDVEDTRLRGVLGSRFESHVGAPETKAIAYNYLALRYRLAEVNLAINTFDAVRTSYDHFRDIVRLWKHDELGLREQIPWLLLRLGRDQEAFSFIKWWNTGCKVPETNSDIFESAFSLCEESNSLNHSAAMTLLKIRPLLVLEKDADFTGKTIEQIFHFMKSSSWKCSDLKGQVQVLLELVHVRNKHFWPALVEQRSQLEVQPRNWTLGSLEETHVVLGYSYSVWRETPGAIDFIRAKIEESRGGSFLHLRR